jgi:hypothetical protein
VSDAEILTLIDAVLALPVSDSAHNDLRVFRSQLQDGTISVDDRSYVINFCRRLQRVNESEKPSALNQHEAEEDEERSRAETSFEPSRPIKNVAIVCRTLVVALVAWILVRVTWPSEFLASQWAELTVSATLLGIFWLLVSVLLAGALFSYALRLPSRKRQFDFWCSFWIYTATTVGFAYGGAMIVLAERPRGAFGNLLRSVSAFLWWLVL